MKTKTHEDRTQAQAKQMFRCAASHRAIKEIQRSCGACVLKGYGEFIWAEFLQPNYSGWQRIYVQAGKPIPARYVEAFLSAAGSGSTLGEAIRADIARFGLRVTAR